jgi:hypothetical protein
LDSFGAAGRSAGPRRDAGAKKARLAAMRERMAEFTDALQRVERCERNGVFTEK